MTICWHVDNLKVSHEDPTEVTAFRECYVERTEWPSPYIEVNSIVIWGWFWTTHAKERSWWTWQIILSPGRDYHYTSHSGSWSSLWSLGCQQLLTIAGGASSGIPSHSGPTSVPEHTGTLLYLSGHSILYHKSKKPRQGCLGKGTEVIRISEGEVACAIDLIGQLIDVVKMVGRRGICSTPWL